MYAKYLKTVVGKVLAVIGILITWPIMILIAVAIKIDSKGKVLFCQERLGKNGNTFKIYKFRTMKENAFSEGTGAYTYDGDRRITRVGKILRKTSLDELPQLFNIVSGKMNFIGPRPLLVDIPFKYEEYPDEYQKRFSVLPGMFCLVDTLYRAEAAFELQCELDIEYIDKITFLEDVKIFIRTFKMVLLQKGIYKQTNVEINKNDVQM